MKWLDNWKKRRDAIAYEAGFSWAAGMLLRGKTADETEHYIYRSEYVDKFDVGVSDALLAWVKLEMKKGVESVKKEDDPNR